MRERLRRAYRQRQSDRDHPRAGVEDGVCVRRGRAAAPAPRGLAGDRRPGQPAAGPASTLRGALGLQPQGRRARQRRPEEHAHLRAHRARDGGQPAPCAGLRAVGRGQRDDEGGRAGHRFQRVGQRAGAGDSGRGQAAREPGLFLRVGGRLLQDPAAESAQHAPPLFRAGGLPRDCREARQRGAVPLRGHGQGQGQRRDRIDGRRGTGAGRRAQRGAAPGPDALLSRDRADHADGLPGAHSGSAGGNPGHDARADRVRRRRAPVGHGGRLREHHRGVVAGFAGQHRVQALRNPRGW